jgi:hypothetical protein
MVLFILATMAEFLRREEDTEQELHLVTDSNAEISLASNRDIDTNTDLGANSGCDENSSTAGSATSGSQFMFGHDNRTLGILVVFVLSLEISVD